VRTQAMVMAAIDSTRLETRIVRAWPRRFFC
jgi:hypothetical protein